MLANAAGDHAGALAIAEATVRACLDDSFPVWVRVALIEAVEAAFELGETGRATELIALVRERFRRGHQPSMDAHILRWEARISAAAGDRDGAAAGFNAAMDGFTAAQRPFWLAVTRLQFAEWLEAQGREAEAREPLALARTTFEELRAAPWADRASRALRAGVA